VSGRCTVPFAMCSCHKVSRHRVLTAHCRSQGRAHAQPEDTGGLLAPAASAHRSPPHPERRCIWTAILLKGRDDPMGCQGTACCRWMKSNRPIVLLAIPGDVNSAKKVPIVAGACIAGQPAHCSGAVVPPAILYLFACQPGASLHELPGEEAMQKRTT
jgi:hypothetical protein